MSKYYWTDLEELEALRDEKQRLEIELAQVKEELRICQEKLQRKATTKNK